MLGRLGGCAAGFASTTLGMGSNPLLDQLFLLRSTAPFASGPYIYDRIGQCWKRVVLGRLGGCATVLLRPPLLAVPAGLPEASLCSAIVPSAAGAFLACVCWSCVVRVSCTVEGKRLSLWRRPFCVPKWSPLHALCASCLLQGLACACRRRTTFASARTALPHARIHAGFCQQLLCAMCTARPPTPAGLRRVSCLREREKTRECQASVLHRVSCVRAVVQPRTGLRLGCWRRLASCITVCRYRLLFIGDEIRS